MSAAPDSSGARKSPDAETDDRLRRDGERVETLLEELQATAGPPTWLRVEELVQRLVGLYGAGLARLLDHARAAGAPDDSLAMRVSDDELLSSLLLLHGLHPSSPSERIQRALEQVRPYLGSHAGDVELLGIDEDGTVRLRLLGSCSSCPSSRATVEHTLRRAVEDSAPEATRIDVEGAGGPQKGPRPTLVQIDVGRSRERSPSQWTPLDAFEPLASGQSRVLEVRGVRMLMMNVGGSLLAYKSHCKACGGDLDGASLAGSTIACVRCNRRYDVARGGRSDRPEGPHLDPVPCLNDAAGPRVSLSVGAP